MRCLVPLLPLFFTLAHTTSCKTSPGNNTDGNYTVQEADAAQATAATQETNGAKGVDSTSNPNLLNSLIRVVTESYLHLKEKACPCQLVKGHNSGAFKSTVECPDHMAYINREVRIAACSPDKLGFLTFALKASNHHFSIIYDQDLGFQVSYKSREYGQPPQELTRIHLPLNQNPKHSRKIPTIDPAIAGAKKTLDAIVDQTPMDRDRDPLGLAILRFRRAFEYQILNQSNTAD